MPNANYSEFSEEGREPKSGSEAKEEARENKPSVRAGRRNGAKGTMTEKNAFPFKGGVLKGQPRNRSGGTPRAKVYPDSEGL